MWGADHHVHVFLCIGGARQEGGRILLGLSDGLVHLPVRSHHRASDHDLLPVLFVGQDCYARQLLAFYVLERSSPTGRDMAHPVFEPELVDGCDRISAANHTRRPTLGDGPGHALRALREGVDLENAHRAVPEDGARIRDVSLEERDSLWPYVETHL